jgi:broad specificity phosphatase PhoE
VILTPTSLLEAVAERVRASPTARTGLIVRHAARHPVFDTSSHLAAVLTDEGHAAAEKTGQQLRALLGHDVEVELWHSPIHRCGQTVHSMARGLGGAHVVRGPMSLLGTPYILDNEGFSAACQRHGRNFLRAWFDGDVADHHCVPLHHAAPEQRDAVTSLVRNSQARVVIGVTHDLNVALVREHHFGHRMTDRWPVFLDGYVVHEDGPAVTSVP